MVKPPASGGFSAADGQAPSTAWAQLPRHGQRRGGQPPAPQPGAGLRPLAALPQLPSKSFLGPFLLHGPPAGPYLNSTWGLRMRPIHGRDPTPGVTPLRRPVPGEGPVTTTTVFDEKPAPHNFGVLKQTCVSAWGLVTADMFAQQQSAASASLTHQAGRASGARGSSSSSNQDCTVPCNTGYTTGFTLAV